MVDCAPTPEVIEQYNKLRRANQSTAFTVKVNKNSNTLELDEVYENTRLEDVAEDLEESNPRFVVYSYKWERTDGRVQFPLILIYYTPEAVSPMINVLYSRSYDPLRKTLNGVQRSYEIREKEEISDSWLVAKLLKA